MVARPARTALNPGMYDFDGRQRRRPWRTFFLTILALGVPVIAGAFGYQLGVELVKSHEQTLEGQLAAVTAQLMSTERTIAQQATAVRQADALALAWQQRYEADVPGGALKSLTDAVKARLAAGVPADRLAFMIDATRPEHDCTPLETKHFMLSVGSRTLAPAVFGNGAVSIIGSGPPARDKAGRVLAWFDPTVPVTIRFLPAGAPAVEVNGLLPIRKTFIAGGVEYRFSVDAAGRANVVATGERCPFP